MLWIGLSLPMLALDTVEAGQQEGCPRIICQDLLVLQANEAALRIGIQPGFKRATALAIAPELQWHERDPAAEQVALERAACWALQFSPRVILQPDAFGDGSGAMLLIDIEASLRLFHGLETVVERMREGLQRLGLHARIACAPTATAAGWFAQWRDGLAARTEAQANGLLAELPLACMPSLRGRHELLATMGLRQFRDLARLPRDGIARRFGAQVPLDMDLALGRQIELRSSFIAPLRFASRLELMADVEHMEALLHAVQRQLEELGGWLVARHCAVRRLRLQGLHDRSRRQPEARPATVWELRFAEAVSDVPRMIGVLREQLGRSRLEAPVHTLILDCREIVEARHRVNELFPMSPSVEEGMGRLVERLQARLGRTQVQRIHIASDHRPESAYACTTLEEVPAARPARRHQATMHQATVHQADPVPSPQGLSPRPLWLLDQPLPLGERRNRPWWNGPLTLLAGPERIEGGWWDEELVQRDYFVAEDEQSRWVWIYRTRASAEEGHDASRGPSWFLQGVFG